jgi:hypothetical protein
MIARFGTFCQRRGSRDKASGTRRVPWPRDERHPVAQNDGTRRVPATIRNHHLATALRGEGRSLGDRPVQDKTPATARKSLNGIPRPSQRLVTGLGSPSSISPSRSARAIYLAVARGRARSLFASSLGAAGLVRVLASLSWADLFLMLASRYRSDILALLAASSIRGHSFPTVLSLPPLVRSRSSCHADSFLYSVRGPARLGSSMFIVRCTAPCLLAGSGIP